MIRGVRIIQRQSGVDVIVCRMRLNALNDFAVKQCEPALKIMLAFPLFFAFFGCALIYLRTRLYRHSALCTLHSATLCQWT